MRTRHLAPVALLALLACHTEKDSGRTDTDADTDADADTDTDTDADADVWVDCPDASAWVGDKAWTGQVTAQDGAWYCGTFNEGRTLEQEMASKAMFRVMPGSYAVPSDDGGYKLGLPVCFLRSDPEPAPVMTGAGPVTVTSTTYGDDRYIYLNGTQPLDAGGTPWTLSYTIYLQGSTDGSVEPLVLDGLAGTNAFTFNLYVTGGDPWSYDTINLTPCTDPIWTLNRHTLTFDGGDMVLDLELGTSMASTEPGAFIRGSGSLDGTGFDQANYWKLIYNPEHHHFSRDFVVLFDKPISGACGLMAKDLDPYYDPPPATVYLVDCALQIIEERTVSVEDWERVKE